LLVGALILGLPFAEEFWRCLRARPYAGRPSARPAAPDHDGLATIR
jgi:hypothetical protein